jgi:hypothetical protein
MTARFLSALFPSLKFCGASLDSRKANVTRNTKDFAGLGVPLLNPWEP